MNRPGKIICVGRNYRAHAAELAELYDSLHRFSKTYRRN